MRSARLGCSLALLLAVPSWPQATPPPDPEPPPAAAQPSVLTPPTPPSETPPATEAAAPTAPAADRITFEVRMPAEHGGGRATGSAGALGLRE